MILLLAFLAAFGVALVAAARYSPRVADALAVALVSASAFFDAKVEPFLAKAAAVAVAIAAKVEPILSPELWRQAFATALDWLRDAWREVGAFLSFVQPPG